MTALAIGFAVLSAVCAATGAYLQHGGVNRVSGGGPPRPRRRPGGGRAPRGVWGGGGPTGHFRNGVLLTPITAELIADLLETGKAADLLTAFDPRRFGQEGSA
jgi:glycine oxidase